MCYAAGKHYAPILWYPGLTTEYLHKWLSEELSKWHWAAACSRYVRTCSRIRESAVTPDCVRGLIVEHVERGTGLACVLPNWLKRGRR